MTRMRRPGHDDQDRPGHDGSDDQGQVTETGELTLVPDTSLEAISERARLAEPTPAQAEAYWREREAEMLPPDDEP